MKILNITLVLLLGTLPAALARADGPTPVLTADITGSIALLNPSGEVAEPPLLISIHGEHACFGSSSAENLSNFALLVPPGDYWLVVETSASEVLRQRISISPESVRHDVKVQLPFFIIPPVVITADEADAFS